LSFARLIPAAVITTTVILASTKSRNETFWYRLTWVLLCCC